MDDLFECHVFARMFEGLLLQIASAKLGVLAQDFKLLLIIPSP
jgi:hypothetical protein